MRVAVEKQDFSKVLTLLSKVANKVTKNYPSGWFKITTDGGALRVEASSDAVHLIVDVPADVKGDGAVCVSADDLLLAVKNEKSKRGAVELSVEGEKLVVISGGIVQKLSIKPVADFIPIQTVHTDFQYLQRCWRMR